MFINCISYKKKGYFLQNKFYCFENIVQDINKFYNETEYGLPKGRRDYKESDFDCALREFSEETGYSSKGLQNVRNVVPFEETFTGSNYNSYKHRYFLMFMD